LPAGPGGELTFRTKYELAVELLREQARITEGKHLGVFDGGYALRSVVRPLVLPEGGGRRLDFLTRLRHDARLHALPPADRPAGTRGPLPKWGRRLDPPRRGGRWERGWRTGVAFIYGRQRQVRWKEVVCLGRVLGHEMPVKAVVAHVEGYKKRFALVTSATELTGLQMVELFAARFRQEDGFRDLKQRLGWEECRAWTKNPIERTSQAQWVTMSLLRLLQFRLEAAGEDDGWFRPPWNQDKDRPSVLDAERLMRRHRAAIRRLLSEWLGDGGETEEAVAGAGCQRARAGIASCSRVRCSSQKRSVARRGRRGDSGGTHHAAIVHYFKETTGYYAHDIIAYDVKAGDPPHEITAALRPGKTIKGEVDPIV
jgi:hypothetical protein